MKFRGITTLIWMITPISQNSRTLQRASRLAALFLNREESPGNKERHTS